MLVTASKFTPARPQQGGPAVRRPGVQTSGPAGAPTIFVPKAGAMESLPSVFWRELREGGAWHAALQRERANTRNRWRAVARRVRDFQQNPKSDLRVLAHVPARDFFRWLRTDPDFFKDNANLRSLRRETERRDGDRLPIYV